MHSIVFQCLFGKNSSETLCLTGNEFQKNIHLYMIFSEYRGTEGLLKSLEEYIYNKHYNQDTADLVFEALSKIFQHRTFIFKTSLKNSPRGIVSERYNRCIRVLKRGDCYNLIVVNKKGCEKINNWLHNLYARSVIFYLYKRFIKKILICLQIFISHIEVW